MPEPIARRFTILDAMILVAALGVGFGMARHVDAKNTSGRLLMNFPITRWNTGLWVLASLSAAHVLIRLRRPRPTWRRIRCQSGFVGSAAVLLAIVYSFVTSLSHFVWLNHFSSLRMVAIPRMGAAGIYVIFFPPLAVLTAWSTLAMVGRLRTESSWIDRFGRSLAVAWIVEALIAVGMQVTGYAYS